MHKNPFKTSKKKGPKPEHSYAVNPEPMSDKQMQDANRRYEAERVVTDAFRKTPEFSRAVSATMQHLKKAEAQTQKIVRGAIKKG